jgi:hypothetical protein
MCVFRLRLQHKEMLQQGYNADGLCYVTSASYIFIAVALINENIVIVSIFSKRSFLNLGTMNFRTHYIDCAYMSPVTHRVDVCTP